MNRKKEYRNCTVVQNSNNHVLIFKNNEMVFHASLVEELKKLNPRFVDRREFKVLDCSGYILKKWNRK